jgi:hypothetical protein
MIGDRMLNISLKKVILFLVGLAALVLCLLFAPLLLIGVTVGFVAGLVVMKRYPQHFKFFTPKSKEEKIKEHQEAIKKLEGR